MLYHTQTKKQIKIGDVVVTRKGVAADVTDINEGRIYIMNHSGIPTQPYGVFHSVVDAEWIDTDLKTHQTMLWMKSMTDDQKTRYAINWRMPHTLFNISCKYKDASELQDIDWNYIYKARDMGYWSHGGLVYPQDFG